MSAAQQIHSHYFISNAYHIAFTFPPYLATTEPAKESVMSAPSAALMMMRSTSLIARLSRTRTPSRSVDGLLMRTSRMPRSMLEDRSKISKHAKLLQKN